MRYFFLFMLLMTGLAGNAQDLSYETLLDSAMNASAANRLEEAEKLYQQVLKLDPANKGNSLVWGNLGSVQQRLDKIDDAVQSYTMALNLEPNLLAVREQRAAIFMDKKDFTRAMLDLSAILDKEPAHEFALLNRAHLRMEQFMLSEARLDFETLLSHYPQHRQGELGMAILAQKQGRYKESADRFAMLIERYPNDPTLYEARGNMERESNQYELALIDYEEAGRISKDPLYNVMQAMVYLDQKKKKTAKIMLDRARKAGMARSLLQEFYDMCK
ncbi:MAG: tetratricopeptide repeat protein [Bacteroidaceae bacterium]|nr:tetratricopeptide repeat protein [Bacteroidaceae bacterium]MCF0185499.1 tetratricopeptide repeat protein [Bacteroidaceae bacterium]